MSKSIQTKQNGEQIVQEVPEDYLTVQYWRTEYHSLVAAFGSLREVANSVAPLIEGERTSADWLSHLKNININKGGKDITRLVVKAMLQAIEADPKKQHILAEQSTPTPYPLPE